MPCFSSLRFLSVSVLVGLCVFSIESVVVASLHHHHRPTHQHSSSIRPLHITIDPTGESTSSTSHPFHIELPTLSNAMDYISTHIQSDQTAHIVLTIDAITELKYYHYEQQKLIKELQMIISSNNKEKEKEETELMKETSNEETDQNMILTNSTDMIQQSDSSSSVVIGDDDDDDDDDADADAAIDSVDMSLMAMGKVVRCSEANLATKADVGAALVGNCAGSTNFLIKKSAHNCQHSNYQCSGVCMKIKQAQKANLETGVCVG